MAYHNNLEPLRTPSLLEGKDTEGKDTHFVKEKTRTS